MHKSSNTGAMGRHMAQRRRSATARLSSIGHVWDRRRLRIWERQELYVVERSIRIASSRGHILPTCHPGHLITNLVSSLLLAHVVGWPTEKKHRASSAICEPSSRSSRRCRSASNPRLTKSLARSRPHRTTSQKRIEFRKLDSKSWTAWVRLSFRRVNPELFGSGLLFKLVAVFRTDFDENL